MKSHHPPAPRSRPGVRRPAIESLERRQLLHGGAGDFHVQFGPAKLAPADGYVVDAGAEFGGRGDDLSFGWTQRRAAKPVARKATPASPDPRHDAFAQVKPGTAWEIALPDGTYRVNLVAGDAKAKRGSYGFDAEGVPALRGEATGDRRWVEGAATVEVTDGRLTITSAEGYRKNKLNFIDIAPADPAALPPPVDDPTPDPTPAPTPLPIPVKAGLGAWRAGAASPVARAEAVGAAVGDTLYVFGGIDGPGEDYAYPVTGRVDAYHPATDTWTPLGLMPEAFTHTVGTVDGTTIWFVGGYLGDTPGPGTAHVWKYDTLRDDWSRGPDLPEPRGGGASAVVGRTLHYFGGTNEDRTQDMGTHWSLDLDDPAAAWTRRADMPLPRNHMAAAAVAGKVYAVGGQRGEGDEAVDLAEIDVYDPATNAWTAVAPMPGPRSHTNASTFELDGQLILIGGESGPGMYHPEVLSYDPAADAWSLFATLPDARSTAVAGIIDDQLVLATGNAPGISDNTWIAPLM